MSVHQKVCFLGCKASFRHAEAIFQTVDLDVDFRWFALLEWLILASLRAVRQWRDLAQGYLVASFATLPA